jgi:hypothetical protein
VQTFAVLVAASRNSGEPPPRLVISTAESMSSWPSRSSVHRSDANSARRAPATAAIRNARHRRSLPHAADWAFAFWLVNTDSGDDVAQWALQLAISWDIEERTAVARSDAGHEWRLAELGPVVDLAAVTDSNDCVAVFDWEHPPAEVLPWHPYSNLARVRPDGVVVWRSPPPSSETLKSWTSVNQSDGRLVAQAWSTRCDVNPETGVITRKEFVK